jgi:hypothetical protein
MSQAEVKASKSNKKYIKYAAAGFVILIIAVLIFLTLVVMRSPAEGTVNNPVPEVVSAKKLKPQKTYTGKYIKFSYPGTYNQLSSENGQSYLETVKLEPNNYSNSLVVISVIKGTLENDPSYALRLYHPDVYKPGSDAQDYPVFTSHTNGTEMITFIPHNGMIATVAMTSSGIKDFSIDMRQIADSLMWLQ